MEILVTADESYRAFERTVVDAVSRIDMGFRVFDARTALLTEEARAYGDTWVYLLLGKLNEGVNITIRISDFDPVVRPKLHLGSHKSLSILMGIAELVDGSGTLRASVEDHPARVGSAPRIALWPKVQSEINKTCDWLNDLNAHSRREAIRCMPRLHEFTYEQDGEIRAKRSGFPAMLPVTHHQKLAVIDDKKLYIGGLDLNNRRYDSLAHDRAPPETWHDVHVLLDDAALAREARDHLEHFRDECAGAVAVRKPDNLLRTLSVRRESNGVSLSPEVCDTGILDRHLELIGEAENLIYLETQFLRDPVLADALSDRAGRAAGLGLVVLLPAAPLEVAFEGEHGLDHQYGEYLQSKCLRQLREAFGDRMFCASPALPRHAASTDQRHIHNAPMIFVHSKVSIFDDQAGLVTSANLNGRSMRWDTETGIEIKDSAQVCELRRRVMTAWLPEGVDPSFWAPNLKTVSVWRSWAQKNAKVDPVSRTGFLLPYEIQPATEFGTNLPGIPVEMV
ncbi:MAG: phospholipase D-like domain-containing protein [Roseobacter sp.]